MSIENIGGASRNTHKPGPIEGGIMPEIGIDEYETKMSALIKQREDFERGIAEYQGNMDKVTALRAKLNKPDLFTDKEAKETWNKWVLNKSEYEGSLRGVESQIRALEAEHGKLPQ
jgi:hypothetical protein